jgi:hypothetical protein
VLDALAGARQRHGEDAERDEAERTYHRRPAPVVPSPHAHRAFRVPGTPYAVVLDEAGTVRAKGTVNNLEQLEGLMATALARFDGPDMAEEHAH